MAEREDIYGEIGSTPGALEPGGGQPPEPPPVTSNYINDQFSGTNGAAIAGRTPDTAENGNTWIAASADIQNNQMRLGSSGNDYAYINVGTTFSNVELMYNPGGGQNRVWIHWGRDTTNLSGKPQNGYATYFAVGGASQTPSLIRFYNGTELDIATAPIGVDLSDLNKDYKIFIQNNDTGYAALYVDDVLIVEGTDTNPLGTLGTHVGVDYGSLDDDGGRFDYYIAGGTSLNVADLEHTAHSLTLLGNVLRPDYKTQTLDAWREGDSRTITDNPAALNKMAFVAIFEKRLLAGGSLGPITWGNQGPTTVYSEELTDATYRYIMYVGFLDDTRIQGMTDGNVWESGDEITGVAFTACYFNVNQFAEISATCSATSQALGDFITCPAAINSRDYSHMVNFGFNDGAGLILTKNAGFEDRIDTVANGTGISIVELEPTV